MDYDAIRGGLQTAVPFNSHVGLQIAEVGPGVGVVKLPDRKELRNHVGSQHAGALFAAGEAASGAAFVGTFGAHLGSIEAVPRSADIRYLQRARGTISATGRLDRDLTELLDEFDETGDVKFCVDVDLANAHGETVAEMTVNWAVKKTSA